MPADAFGRARGRTQPVGLLSSHPPASQVPPVQVFKVPRATRVSGKEVKQRLTPGSSGRREREAYRWGFPALGETLLTVVGSDPKAQARL